MFDKPFEGDEGWERPRDSPGILNSGPEYFGNSHKAAADGPSFFCPSESSVSLKKMPAEPQPLLSLGASLGQEEEGESSEGRDLVGEPEAEELGELGAVTLSDSCPYAPGRDFVGVGIGSLSIRRICGRAVGGDWAPACSGHCLRFFGGERGARPLFGTTAGCCRKKGEDAMRAGGGAIPGGMRGGKSTFAREDVASGGEVDGPGRIGTDCCCCVGEILAVVEALVGDSSAGFGLAAVDSVVVLAVVVVAAGRELGCVAALLLGAAVPVVGVVVVVVVVVVVGCSTASGGRRPTGLARRKEPRGLTSALLLLPRAPLAFSAINRC